MSAARLRRASHSARLLRLAALIAVAAVLGVIARNRRARPPSPVSNPRSAATTPDVVRGFVAIEAREAEVDRTVWGPAHAAHEHGAAIVRLWNTLNTASNAFEVLRDVAHHSFSAPPPALVSQRQLPHGIALQAATNHPDTTQSVDWKALAASWILEGWRLEQSEWRHRRFEPATPQSPASSWYEVHLHLGRASPPSRAQLEASVRFQWPAAPSAQGVVDLGEIRVESFQLLTRDGPPVFQPVASFEIAPFARTAWIDPLIARVDDSGPRLILAARNLVLRRAPDGRWSEHPLSPHHPGLAFTALFADFTGDAAEDLLFAVRSGLVLLRGDANGGFTHAAERAWEAPTPLVYAQAFTCGDLEGDGDLDVFLGQYRAPYEGGQMPRPYFDANDGPPAYLLRNTGRGQFEDVTAGSGLEPRRHRRSYAASFIDLDHDSDLDLVVTSDFAGIDVHSNEGQGRFTDRTAGWVDESRAFGMAHAFADLNSDGRLDILLVGMPQDTAERLDFLQLERPGFETWISQRSRVTYGNRLYLGGFEGFRQAPLGQAIARAGWAWSAAAIDVDNNRHVDLHIVNGHESRQSVEDYEQEFWMHDIYAGDSTPRPEVDAYFGGKFARTRALGWSYGGHHKNRFYLNLDGAEFVETGHLFGVALAADSRNALAADFDGDGDSDLVVTTFEIWPRPRQTLQIFENTLSTQGHWIGFRLQGAPGGGGVTLPGTEIVIRDSMGSQPGVWVTGEGYRSQAASGMRFGLGKSEVVEEALIRWPGGAETRMGPLAADKVYSIQAVPLPARHTETVAP